ncbi:MAG: signal peptide peptidase SppA [Rhodospirillaceae bacterium]
MVFNPDVLFDRRRLKRRLTLWRLVALAALGALAVALFGRSGGLLERDHVVRFDIEGVIFDDRDRIATLRTLADAPAIRAVIVHVDSPGGTFSGGEALYRALRDLARKKPVAAVMGGTATSAGYMVAVAADHVVARDGTLTGSIGVILQTADVTGLLQKLGVRSEVFKTGPLKAQPNPLEPITDAAREATKIVIDDLFRQFVDIVAERRKMERAAVLKLADGRIFTGRKAKDLGLIDATGSEAQARAWLARARNVPESVPVRDLDAFPGGSDWRDMLSQYLKKALFSERVKLDGVFALWHPSI